MKPLLREARSESLDSQILPICLCACFDTLCNTVTVQSRSNGFVFQSCKSKESLAVNHKKSPFTTKEMDKQQMGQRLRTMRQELTSQPQQSALFRHAIGFPCFFLQLSQIGLEIVHLQSDRCLTYFVKCHIYKVNKITLQT